MVEAGETTGLNVGSDEMMDLVDYLPTTVVSGGAVTDHGASNSKVDVTACTYYYQGKKATAAAVSALTTANGHHIVVDMADGTIKDVATVLSTHVYLADCAVNANVVTPTAKRPTLATTTF
jgi:hypothetical protein